MTQSVTDKRMDRQNWRNIYRACSLHTAVTVGTQCVVALSISGDIPARSHVVGTGTRHRRHLCLELLQVGVEKCQKIH